MKKDKMTIKQRDVLKHTPNPIHVQNILQGSRVVKNRKGKGSYTRKQKHKNIY